ncbi:MAG: hypothetical protein ACXW18_10030 [Pyrinomonadaceae bacterium]
MKKVFARFGQPVLLLALAGVALWLPHFFVAVSQSTLVLTLTFLAVIWYTWETRRMQLAVVRQTDELIYNRRLSILPNLSVGFTRKNVMFPPHVVECLELRNIGNGAAVNIEVDDVHVSYAENAVARFRFDRFVFLEPNRDSSATQKFAHLRIFIDNEANLPEDATEFATWVMPSEFGSNPISFLKAHTEEDRVTLAMRFQDVDGLRYQQRVTMQIDGNKLHPLKLGRPMNQE